ncbi:hypothetical protein [Salinicola acroporae]|uniref:hypothetical protein n=1 Tax=Salinicola acroporae TaxID=1541440 RepID=UPI0031B9C3F8
MLGVGELAFGFEQQPGSTVAGAAKPLKLNQAAVSVSNRLPQHRIRIAQRRGDDLQGVLQGFAALGGADADTNRLGALTLPRQKLSAVLTLTPCAWSWPTTWLVRNSPGSASHR